MGFTFNRDAAIKAGTSEYITESGVYVGKLTKAFETAYDSGAVSITFDFVSKDEQKASYLRIFTRKKDGTDAFGVNHICALMGLLRLTNADPVRIDDEHTGYPMFCNKPIGVILQREEKEGGKFGFNILHFLEPSTLKTFSEFVSGEEAKESKKEIKDKAYKPTADTSFNFGANVPSVQDKDKQFNNMFGPPADELPWEVKK